MDDDDRMAMEWDDDFGDGLDEIGSGDEIDGFSNYDIEMAGSLDGEQEKGLGMADDSNYGAGIDLSKLTDEQREIYDNAFYSSRN